MPRADKSQPRATSWRSLRVFLRAIRGALDEHFFHALARAAAHGERHVVNLQMSARFRQIAELVENEAANRVESFFFQVKTKLREIIEPRPAARDHAPVAEMLDVKRRVG